MDGHWVRPDWPLLIGHELLAGGPVIASTSPCPIHRAFVFYAMSGPKRPKSRFAWRVERATPLIVKYTMNGHKASWVEP